MEVNRHLPWYTAFHIDIRYQNVANYIFPGEVFVLDDHLLTNVYFVYTRNSPTDVMLRITRYGAYQ